jgi:hypothetical protein
MIPKNGTTEYEALKAGGYIRSAWEYEEAVQETGCENEALSA